MNQQLRNELRRTLNAFKTLLDLNREQRTEMLQLSESLQRIAIKVAKSTRR